MKRIIPVVLALMVLISPALAQPYVTVFEGRLSPDQALEVGNHTLTVVQAADGSYYLMLRNGSRIVELKPFAFGTEIERDGLRVILGSYTAEGGFVVVSVKPDFVTALEPEAGARATFNGNVVEVTAVGERTVDVSVNGVSRTLEINGTAVVDLIALEYDGKEIKVYAAQPASEAIAPAYSLFYPYQKVRTTGPVDVPITITSSSISDVTLPLKVLSIPDGWKAGFLYGGIEVKEITLPAGGSITVTLHVEPSGSGTITFAVGNVTGSLEVELSGVEVSLPYTGVEAEAGESLTVPLTFTGTGTVEFRPGELESGWSLYLTDGQYRLRSFEVAGSFTASLVVEIPRNATLGNHRVEFFINGKKHGLDVYVYKTYLGQPARLTVLLVDDSGNPLEGWVSIGGRNVTAPAGRGAVFELKPGTYTLTAGANGCTPVEERIKLLDGEEKSITVTLNRADYYFEAALESDVITAGPGSSGDVAITIRNLGSREDEYGVKVTGLPDGWSYVLSQDPQGTIPVGSLKAQPGQSVNAYLVIIPPFNVESGELEAKVIVSGKGTSVELPLTIRVENPATLSLTPDYPSLTVKAGGSTATTIWVDASGTVTNVKFSVQAPNGWEVEVVPDTIPRIGVMQQGGNVWVSGGQSVELRIRVPKSAPAGTYTIRVSAAGDQAMAETVVTVRVTQSSSSAYIGVLLLVVAFGIVFWLMRRVGRR
ncbi:hypothetical protein CL1_1980 [Thermococcus cleftensis]|uniref:Alpha-galactosidase NEW3 domain-containing protein n=1 Tax=Thermococcus cleftensis (strain DSM 27260 / KACC 17922 / CL1) TaxID=163003 RepID=I3ZWU1_THECF|nr:NEW3 domain-containing protein [Thermococcus cleftensis]AFL96175.1 hypothetical protein CL1_1980 [Thermococcus cleftensis]